MQLRTVQHTCHALALILKVDIGSCPGERCYGGGAVAISGVTNRYSGHLQVAQRVVVSRLMYRIMVLFEQQCLDARMMASSSSAPTTTLVRHLISLSSRSCGIDGVDFRSVILREDH